MIQMNCQGLTLGYDSVLVRDLSFTIHAGDYLYILGENGTGKSTLMRTILGLLPPLEGSVVLGGGVLPAEIGYLPQQTPLQRDFPASVQEVVLSVSNMYIGKYNGLQQLGQPEYTQQYGWEATFMTYEHFLQHVRLNGMPDVSKVDTIDIDLGNLPSSGDELIRLQGQLVRLRNVHFPEADGRRPDYILGCRCKHQPHCGRCQWQYHHHAKQQLCRFPTRLAADG